MAGAAELFTTFAASFWSILAEMSPYLLFGFTFAGLLSVVFSAETVERHLGGSRFGSVLKAALFGVPLPLCSCGVIPVGAGLKKQGAGKGAVVSFLISTPQTGVDSIFVTYSLLGPLMAIIKPVAALVTGVVGGTITNLIEKEDPVEPGAACLREDCIDQARASWLRRALHYAFVELPKDTAMYLLIGLVLAGLIGAVAPTDLFAGRLGTGITGMLLMMLFGIPLYVCAAASVPIAAALSLKGASLGAVLVFLMTGPATNAATLTTIWRVLGKRSTFVYLLSIAVGALAFGLLLEWAELHPSLSAMAKVHVHPEGPGIFKSASAVVLIAILGWGYLAPLLKRSGSKVGSDVTGAERIALSVEGMTCGHCAESVKKAVCSVAGVEVAEVDLKAGSITIGGSGVNTEDIIKVIGAAGYTAKAPEDPT